MHARLILWLSVPVLWVALGPGEAYKQDNLSYWYHLSAMLSSPVCLLIAPRGPVPVRWSHTPQGA